MNLPPCWMGSPGGRGEEGGGKGGRGGGPLRKSCLVKTRQPSILHLLW